MKSILYFSKTAYRSLQIFFVIVLLFPLCSSAQDDPISFRTLTTANGLPSNLVLGVAASGNNIYAATSNGLAISTDGGASFVTKTTTDGLGDNFVKKIFLDGSTIYVTTKGGLSISTDNGNSFVNHKTGLSYSSVDNFGYVYVEESTIYVSSGVGLFISTDGGATFTRKTISDGLGHNAVGEIIANESIVYATTRGGLSISTDGGSTFINKTLVDGLANKDALGLALSGSTLYVASEGSSPVGGLSITSDMGNNFTVKLQGQSANNVSVVGDNIYVGHSSSTLSVSHDGGNTFKRYTFRDGIPGITVDTYIDGTTVYVATHAGIAVGEDPNLSAGTGDEGNIALNKPAQQSSNYNTWTASNAVDGNTDQTLSHTLNTENAWWEVDLGAIYDISEIKIWNRSGSYNDRIKGFYVTVSETSQPNNTQNNVFAGPVDEIKNLYELSGNSDSRQGRYVRIFLTKNDYLHMREVEVFGTFVREVEEEIELESTALNIEAVQQSSTYSNWVASNAVDGNTDNTDNTMSHTLNTENAWWEVDLGAIYDISEIKIWNRSGSYNDRIKGFYVTVSETSQPNNTQNNVFAGPVNEIKNLYELSGNSGSRQGRYVRIFLTRNDYLHMREVGIFGTFVR